MVVELGVLLNLWLRVVLQEVRELALWLKVLVVEVVGGELRLHVRRVHLLLELFRVSVLYLSLSLLRLLKRV